MSVLELRDKVTRDPRVKNFMERFNASIISCTPETDIQFSESGREK